MTGRQIIEKICATTEDIDEDIFVVEILHRGEDFAVEKAERCPVVRVSGYKIHIEASQMYDRGY